MSELRFTDDHEWLRVEADGSVTVGITAYAQHALGMWCSCSCRSCSTMTKAAKRPP